MRILFMACVLFAVPAFGQDYQAQMDEMGHEQYMRDAQEQSDRWNAQLQAEKQADMDRQHQQERMDDNGMFGR